MINLKEHIKKITLWVSLEDDDEINRKFDSLKEDLVNKHRETTNEKRRILLDAARDVKDVELRRHLLSLAEKAKSDNKEVEAVLDSRLNSLQAVFDVKSGKDD